MLDQRYALGSLTALEPYEDFGTYAEASKVARHRAQRGTTTVIYKAVPVAVFEARVTVEEVPCPEGIE